MKTMKKCRGNAIRLILQIMLILTLTGCSGYSKFYTQRIDDNGLMTLETLKEGQIPILVKTNNLKSEIDKYRAKNYSIIGVSSFNGSMESDENIIYQATAVKATLVLQTSSFVSSQLVSTPLFTPNGFGGINSTAMHSQQMRYDQAAAFMAKSTRKPRVGVSVQDLTPEQRKQYERNAGVVVLIVFEGSPAFEANVLTGDLVIGIDGNIVQGQEHAQKLLTTIPKTADKVILKVIRNNIEKDIEVILDKS